MNYDYVKSYCTINGHISFWDFSGVFLFSKTYIQLMFDIKGIYT